MGLREDLYKDVDRLYQRRIARVHFLKEKSLEAVREGRLPAGLDDRTKDVIRWILEDREMRLRRKRDLRVLRAEWEEDREERRRELAETRANWRKVQARVRAGKAMLARPREAKVARLEEEPEWKRELAAILEAAEEVAEIGADGRVRAGKDMLGMQLKGKAAKAQKQTEEAEALVAGGLGEDGSREVGWQIGERR